MNIWQPIISLFTTAGKINPIAILLMLGASFYVYNDVQGWAEQREIKRQCDLYRIAAQDKLENLTRSNNEVGETIKSIDLDNLNEWVDRINRMQREPE